MNNKVPANESQHASLDGPAPPQGDSQLALADRHHDLEARIKRLSEQLRRIELRSDELERMREAMDRLVCTLEDEYRRKRMGQK